MLVGLALLGAAATAVLPAQTSRPATTRADVVRWMTTLSNWGRWGGDDQLGTVNLITPARRKAAAAVGQMGLVHTWESFFQKHGLHTCLLYTSDAADERSSVDLGGRRIIKKKTKNT